MKIKRLPSPKKGALMMSILAIFIIQTANSQCIIDVDSDNWSDKRYTIQDAFTDFNNQVKPWTASTYRGIEGPGGNEGLHENTPQESRIVNGELRAEYLKDEASGRNGGFLFDSYFDAEEEAYLEYTVRFEPGFEFWGGGKLPGLGGSTNGAGQEVGGNGSIPSGGNYNENGFSARLMWRRTFNGGTIPQGNPYLILYSYFYKKEDGSNRPSSGTPGDSYRIINNITANTTYKIKQYMKMNTPGQNNGIVRIWVNDVLELEETDLHIRKSGKNNLKINSLIMHTYRGGGRYDSRWYTDEDEYAFFDNFKVWTGGSTSPCDGGGGGSQGAYNGPHNIPGLLQAEDFDNGGQGVAYNDNESANNGGAGRTGEGVDVANTSDAGGGLEVGWTRNNEWLEYTMANVQSGTYDIKFRVSSNVSTTKSINANLDGQNLGTVSVPNTGGWSNYQDVTLNNVAINGGSDEILRLTFNTGSINLNHVTFTSIGQSAFNGPHNIPGVLEAEDYDNGGQGVAYNDNDPENKGGAGRINSGVDVANTSDNSGGQEVGWTNDGEWLEYSMANIEAGSYDIKFRIASNASFSKSITASLDGQNLGTVTVPSTGGWSNWQNAIMTNVNISGGSNEVLRLTINGGGINLNNVTFTKLSGGSGNLEGSYRLVNVRSDRYLDSDGTNIKVGTSASGSDKQWEIVNSAGSNYNIDSKFNGRGVIEALNGNAIAGTSQEPISTINRREWTFYEIAPGEYLIQNVDKGGYLAEVSNSSSSDVQWTTWNGARARWKLEPVVSSLEIFDNGNNEIAIPINLERLTIFPSPTDDIVNILGLNKGRTSIEIYDVTGKLVIVQENKEYTQASIDVSSLLPGSYFVKVVEEQGSQTLRFIKQ